MATPDPTPHHLRGEVRPPAMSPLEDQRVTKVTGWFLLICGLLVILGLTSMVLVFFYTVARGMLS
jgi:hypothetical protein